MSGLYVHIPFCKQACTYCDFHFSTSMGQRDRVMTAIANELDLRALEADGMALGSIYLGGGTPSVVGPDALNDLFARIRQNYGLASAAEVTIEANPDDITEEELAQWKDLGVTRVSLGIQSFRDDRLKWMGRAHDATQARQSIDLIAKAGFTSWTIDLIYGLSLIHISEPTRPY